MMFKTDFIARSLIIAGVAALSASPALAAEAGTPYLENPTIWALIGLIVFLAGVFAVGGFKAVTDGLDKRAEDIRAELEEAKALREAAQKRLAETERKHREAEEEAAAIVAQAKADASAILTRSQAELKERLARREQQASERIERAGAEAERDVRAAAADAAIRAARDVAAEQAKKDGGADLFEKAMVDIRKAI